MEFVTIVDIGGISHTVLASAIARVTPAALPGSVSGVTIVLTTGEVIQAPSAPATFKTALAAAAPSSSFYGVADQNGVTHQVNAAAIAHVAPAALHAGGGLALTLSTGEVIQAPTAVSDFQTAIVIAIPAISINLTEL